MGALLTRLRDSQLRDAASKPWSWSGPAGDHSPYPNDLVKFPGPELLYCFVDILTSYKIMRKFSVISCLLKKNNYIDALPQYIQKTSISIGEQSIVPFLRMAEAPVQFSSVQFSLGPSPALQDRIR